MRSDTSLPQIFLEQIDKLDENQLILLNQMIVERLKLINQVHHLSALSKFHVGQKVKFNRHGRTENAVVTKLNKKTVSIVTDSQEQWNVSPSFLF